MSILYSERTALYVQYVPCRKKIYASGRRPLASALTFLVVAFCRFPFPHRARAGTSTSATRSSSCSPRCCRSPTESRPRPSAPALADVASGYAIYAPFTLLIKAAMAACFDSRRRGCGARNLLGAAVAVVILVVGYYLADAILTGSFVVPLAAAPFNLIQGAVSAALFAGLSYILEKSAFYAGLRDELR